MSIGLLLGLILIVGCAALGLGVIYTGAVYRCTQGSSPTCARVPQPGIEVYLLNSFFDQSSSSAVLQVTRTDAAGRFWFFGAPLGAEATVRVGNYAPNTWIGSEDSQPYCAFAGNGLGTLSRDIDIYNPDDYRTIIGDHGGLYMTLKICPQALR